MDAEIRFLEDLADSYRVDSLDEAGLLKAAKICRKYRDLELGLADASVLVLAQKWSTRALGSFNERDFRTVRPLQGGSFTLLPADA